MQCRGREEEDGDVSWSGPRRWVWQSLRCKAGALVVRDGFGECEQKWDEETSSRGRMRERKKEGTR